MVAAGVLCLFAGCLEVDVLVEMHDKDPGATVREKVRISRELQQVSLRAGTQGEILAHLEKKAALERMKHMGKGVSLVSHKKEKLPDGSVQSIAVYTIPHINHLRITCPYVHEHPPGAGAHIGYGLHKARDRSDGQIWVGVRTVDRKKKYPSGMTKRARSPLEQQALRELQPAIADMVSDMRIRVRLKVPTRYLYKYVRNLKSGPNTATIVSLEGWDRDRHGNGFFENEEILLDLLEMEVNSNTVRHHTSAFPNNWGVPVLRAHGHGLYRPGDFRIHPSSYHFQKYHKKKPAAGKKSSGK